MRTGSVDVRLRAWLFVLVLSVLLVFWGGEHRGLAGPDDAPGKPPAGNVVYLAHRARDGNDQGWMADGEIAGFPHDGPSIENIRICGAGPIQIRQADAGWQKDWTKEGDEAGQTHRAGKQMEAIRFQKPPDNLWICLFENPAGGFGWQLPQQVKAGVACGITGKNVAIKAVQLVIAPSQDAAAKALVQVEKSESTLRDYVESNKYLEASTKEAIAQALRDRGHNPNDFTIGAGWELFGLRRRSDAAGPIVLITLRGQVFVDPRAGENRVVFDSDISIPLNGKPTGATPNVSVTTRNFHSDSSGPLPWPLWKQEFPGHLEGVVKDKTGPGLEKFVRETLSEFISPK